jgi:hypothetical protein
MGSYPLQIESFYEDFSFDSCPANISRFHPAGFIIETSYSSQRIFEWLVALILCAFHAFFMVQPLTCAYRCSR